jgi:hypothetical protein
LGRKWQKKNKGWRNLNGMSLFHSFSADSGGGAESKGKKAQFRLGGAMVEKRISPLRRSQKRERLRSK